MTTKTFRVSVAASVLLTVLLRLRFFCTPLTSDEGGYLAIGRAWGHGRDLYRQVWIDRPQGLLALFRYWDNIFGGSTASIRVMATVFAALAVVSGAVIARSIASARAGVIAAAFVAVVSSAATLEGFIANGELLSGALSVAGLGAGCVVLFGHRKLRWMYVSGVFAGLAMSIKQSGFDGFAALFVWLLLALVFSWHERAFLWRCIGLLIGGLASVLALLALHGALTGWHDWWFAVAGYRLDSRSALVGADWGRLHTTAMYAMPTLAPLLIVGAACGIAARLRGAVRFRNDHLLLLLWLLAATAAFVSGGQFHRHYWITVTFPVAIGAAVLISSVRRQGLQIALALGVVVPSLFSTLRIVGLPRDEVPTQSSSDGRLVADEKIADWYLANRAPGDTLYAFCASAGLYGNALEDPPFPYLWFDGVRLIPGALDALRAMLSSSDRPTYVAVYQLPRACDESGKSEALLEKNYVPLTSVQGVKILVRSDR